MKEHYEIWLQPWCSDCERNPGDGRMWAPDDPWTKCEDCDRGAVRYVLAKPGRVLVPDNDWAFMARFAALPSEAKRVIMSAAKELGGDDDQT